MGFYENVNILGVTSQELIYRGLLLVTLRGDILIESNLAVPAL